MRTPPTLLVLTETSSRVHSVELARCVQSQKAVVCQAATIVNYSSTLIIAQFPILHRVAHDSYEATANERLAKPIRDKRPQLLPILLLSLLQDATAVVAVAAMAKSAILLS